MDARHHASVLTIVSVPNNKEAGIYEQICVSFSIACAGCRNQSGARTSRPAGRVSAAEQSTSGDSSKKKTTAKDSSGLEEIVVTAERRESTVQKTPISMTAVSEQISWRAASGICNRSRSNSGHLDKNSGPGQTEFEMRGLTATGGFSPTVGFYVDDARSDGTVSGRAGQDGHRSRSIRREPRRSLAWTPGNTLRLPGPWAARSNWSRITAEFNKVSISAQTTDSDTDGGGFNDGGSAMLNFPLVQDVVGAATRGHVQIYLRVHRPDRGGSRFPWQTNGGLSRGYVLAAPVQAEIFRRELGKAPEADESPC